MEYDHSACSVMQGTNACRMRLMPSSQTAMALRIAASSSANFTFLASATSHGRR